MLRLITHLLLAYALLLGPALCLGGLLEHDCDCGGEGAAECQHEDSCPDDPCAPVLRTEEMDALPNFEFASRLIQAPLFTLDVEPASVRWSWSSRPPLPPDRWNLPYAQSDRPQLI